MLKKDREALEIAETHVIDLYTSFSTDETEHWELDKEDQLKLDFKNGYLACGIHSSRIVDYQADDDGEEWLIEVVPDVGIVLNPEMCRVYEADEEWVVE